MAMYKPHVLLLLLSLFISSAFLSLGFHLRSPREELSELLTESNPESPRREYEHCQQRCQEEQGNRRQEECQQQCEQRMSEREYQEEDDPLRQYEQCQQRCHRQHHDRRQQRQCQQMCTMEYEERQEEEESRQDPRQRYQQCRERCDWQQSDERQQRRCRQRCHSEYEEQQEGRRDNPQEPCKQYEQCRERCQRQHQSQKKQQQCQRTCREQLEEQQEGCKSEREEESNNPFFIRSQWFQPRFKAGQGHWSILPKFNQMSPLLRGIENYRLSILDAHANTFVVPHHRDSESVFVVVRGQGTITFVSDDGRQSFNVKYGDVTRVPAGTTVYMVNSQRDDKFIIASINEPVNAPGHFQEFLLGGGEEPKDYLEVSRIENLAASWNTTKDQIRKLFGGKSQVGRIRNASEEQLSALSAEASSSPRHSAYLSPIELLNQHPVYSNENGRFHEACPAEFKQLHNIDVCISALQMNKGSIFLPHFNSKQMMVFLITEGSAYFEMVSPQLPRQSQEEQSAEEEEEQMSGRCQRVTARANPGDIFITPPDHPVSLIASQNEDMKAIGFGINAKNNQRIFLAGRNNIVRNMEREAQELSFGVPARLVEQVFNKQDESHFVSASQQRQPRENSVSFI